MVLHFYPENRSAAAADMARPTRSSTTKRKPFGERSNDTALAPATKKVSKTKKKTAKAKKKARRQSRQIGDDVIFYVSAGIQSTGATMVAPNLQNDWFLDPLLHQHVAGSTRALRLPYSTMCSNLLLLSAL